VRLGQEVANATLLGVEGDRCSSTRSSPSSTSTFPSRRCRGPVSSTWRRTGRRTHPRRESAPARAPRGSRRAGRRDRLPARSRRRAESPRLAGRLHGDAPVEAPGPEQGGIEHVAPVGRADHDHAGRGVEAVHLGQDLIQGLLPLVVAAEAAGHGRARAADRVELVDDDDGRRGALSPREETRTREAPTPTIISMNSDADMEKKGTPASPAPARARSVLPVPGEPERRTPLGMRRRASGTSPGCGGSRRPRRAPPSPRRCPRRRRT
jgi:hypothetical protein